MINMDFYTFCKISNPIGFYSIMKLFRLKLKLGLKNKKKIKIFFMKIKKIEIR